MTSASGEASRFWSSGHYEFFHQRGCWSIVSQTVNCKVAIDQTNSRFLTSQCIVGQSISVIHQKKGRKWNKYLEWHNTKIECFPNGKMYHLFLLRSVGGGVFFYPMKITLSFNFLFLWVIQWYSRCKCFFVFCFLWSQKHSVWLRGLMDDFNLCRRLARSMQPLHYLDSYSWVAWIE